MNPNNNPNNQSSNKSGPSAQEQLKKGLEIIFKLTKKSGKKLSELGDTVKHGFEVPKELVRKTNSGIVALNVAAINPATLAKKSLILGGRGHMALGQKTKGQTIMLLAIVGYILLILPGILITLLGVYDTRVIANRLCEGKSVGFWEFFWNKAYQGERRWNVIDIVPTHREEEYVGSEQRTIDNSCSSSPIQRKISVTREWTQAYTVEYEKAQILSTSQHVDVGKNMTRTKTVEDQFREKSSYSLGEKNTHSEDVTLDVLPGKIVQVILNWKNIIQIGVIKLEDNNQDKIEIPYRVIIGLTFDQQQVDLVENSLA